MTLACLSGAFHDARRYVEYQQVLLDHGQSLVIFVVVDTDDGDYGSSVRMLNPDEILRLDHQRLKVADSYEPVKLDVHVFGGNLDVGDRDDVNGNVVMVVEQDHG